MNRVLQVLRIEPVEQQRLSNNLVTRCETQELEILEIDLVMTLEVLVRIFQERLLGLPAW